MWARARGERTAQIAAPAAAVGAARRLPSLLASGSCGRTRCARFARSAQTCGRKSDFTKRATRADPEAARLGAAEVAAICAVRSPRALAHIPAVAHPIRNRTRPAATCRSSNAGESATHPQKLKPGSDYDFHGNRGPTPVLPSNEDGGIRSAPEPKHALRGPPTHLAKARAGCRGRACAQPRSAAAPARARSARRTLTRRVCLSGARFARVASYAAPAGDASIAGKGNRGQTTISVGNRGLTPVSPSTRAPAAAGPRLCAHRDR